MIKFKYLLILLCVLFFGSIYHISAQEDIISVSIMQMVSHPSLDKINSGIKAQLKEEGYIEGKNLIINEYNAQGEMAMLQGMAQQVVADQPDFIFAITTPVAQSLQNTNTDIPIILAGITDPVSSKLVSNDLLPSANMSGVSDYIPVKEQMNFIKKEFPTIKTIGFIYSLTEEQAKSEIQEAEKQALALGYKTKVVGINQSHEMANIVQNLGKDVEVIYTGSDNMIASAYEVLIEYSHNHYIPLITPVKELIDAGAYGGVAIDQSEIGRKSVGFMIQIIRDNKYIGDIPILRLKGIKPTYNTQFKQKYKTHSIKYNPLTALNTNIYLQAILQGLLWSIYAIGLYITFRILNFADLTSEASFTMGAVMTVTLLQNGYFFISATLIAFMVGMLCGGLTGLLISVLKIPGILASIISLTAAYSINLLILGKPNVSVRELPTLFSNPLLNLNQNILVSIGIIMLLVSVLILGLYTFLKTEIGLSLIATGDNEVMADAFGINIKLIKMSAIMLANGGIALSGSLIAQHQGFGDISMGMGSVVIGLSSIVLGEIILSKETTLIKRLILTVIGSIIYQLLISIVLQIGLAPVYYKLVTALLFILMMLLPKIKQRFGGILK